MREREREREKERQTWRIGECLGKEGLRKKQADRETETDGQLDKASCVWCVCVWEREREGLLDIAELILFQSAGLVQI